MVLSQHVHRAFQLTHALEVVLLLLLVLSLLRVPNLLHRFQCFSRATRSPCPASSPRARTSLPWPRSLQRYYLPSSNRVCASSRSQYLASKFLLHQSLRHSHAFSASLICAEMDFLRSVSATTTGFRARAACSRSAASTPAEAEAVSSERALDSAPEDEAEAEASTPHVAPNSACDTSAIFQMRILVPWLWLWKTISKFHYVIRILTLPLPRPRQLDTDTRGHTRIHCAPQMYTYTTCTLPPPATMDSYNRQGNVIVLKQVGLDRGSYIAEQTRARRTSKQAKKLPKRTTKHILTSNALFLFFPE